MSGIYRKRRLVFVIVSLVGVIFASIVTLSSQPFSLTPMPVNNRAQVGSVAHDTLNQLVVKGRSQKTGYARTEFVDGWQIINGCDTRETILHRDLAGAVVDKSCFVTKCTLNDPYKGKVIEFVRGASTSSLVQIDHIVALSDAWQKGAQQLSLEKRTQLANDPLELLAVDGSANQQKSDGDAASWLSPNKSFRCQYVARQIAVKQKYDLWVTSAEKTAMQSVLDSCPNQALPKA